MTYNFCALKRATLQCLLAFTVSSSTAASLGQDEIEQKPAYTVLKTLPHDTAIFTQGLISNNKTLIESSGLYGKSFIRIYTAETGETLKHHNLSPEIFAEGLTLFNHQLYLLTWRAGVLFVLDPTSLSVKKTLRYKGEGWGITHDNAFLYTSDGSQQITRRDPASFKLLSKIAVTDTVSDKPVFQLNELEYAHQRLWANQWRSNTIWSIDPATGKAQAIDLSELVPTELRASTHKVLNGIAYDPQADAFWITGKNWPVRYLVDIP